MADRSIEYMRLDQIPRARRNPKGHAKKTISESISRHGFVEAPTIDERTGRLVAGHGRLDELDAARAAGKTAPEGVQVDTEGAWFVPVQRGWASRNDAEAEAYLLTSNQASIAGGWNVPELVPMIIELQTGGGLVGVGFSDDEIAALLDPPKDPWRNRAKAPMPDARGLTTGEVWDVGPHRLVIGDAQDPACWAVLPMAHLVITDPPYGIDYGGGGLEREAIDGDNPAMAAPLLRNVAERIAGHAHPGAAVYTFLPQGDQFPTMLGVLNDQGLFRWSIVWVKPNATFGRADFHMQHENISYGWTPAPARLRPVEDRKLTSVWRVDRPSASKDHPTAKPVELLTIPIKASSLDGDIVMDPFAGSGSTLVAAATMGRIGCGIELRPEYARVTLDRLEKATGLSAVLATDASTASLT